MPAERPPRRSHRPSLAAIKADITATDLAEVDLPVLVLFGTGSPEAHRTAARQLARVVPGARLVEIADCGHVVYAERPGEFARAVTDFGAEIDALTSPAQRASLRGAVR